MSSLLSKESAWRFLVYILIFVIYVRVVEHFSLFYPSKKISATPRDIGLPFEDVLITTEDGLQINSWIIAVLAKARGGRAKRGSIWMPRQPMIIW